MNLLKTLANNWRDILVAFTLTLGLAIAADVLEKIAAQEDGSVWLANVVISIRGLAAFAGANLAAFFMLAVAWPTIQKWNNENYVDTWQHLPSWGRFATFIAVAIAYILAAAICFAP
jgi:hypothetical protein